MNTPIADFINNYINSDMSRLHMPGHKGNENALDITEISGADSLYEASGIIAQSEKNATEIFGSLQTLYSCEGSSQCIKAMLMLAVINRENKKARPLVFAARNVHKAFLQAAALIDFDVNWLYSDFTDSICECKISENQLREELKGAKAKPCAVYITSPDYLGNIADIKGLSKVCKEFDVPLLVDNAHGAYLKFLKEHPIDFGADMCCDSAHKTLPVLTGGAYLHINNKRFLKNAKDVLGVFGSTSPSYTILASLDKANRYMAEKITSDILDCVEKINEIKVYITDKCDEKLKVRIDADNFLKSGIEIAEYLRENKIECEYADEQFVILMFSPFNSLTDFTRIKSAVKGIEKCEKKVENKFKMPENIQVMSIREAYFSEQEEVLVDSAKDRICGFSTVSCPPAVPIAVAGEKITENHIGLFKKYKIEKIKVIAF